MATANRRNIYAEVVLRSQTGASLLRDTIRITPANLHMFQARAGAPTELKEKLEQIGFTVLAASRFGISITGPEELYEDFFQAKIVERPVRMFLGERLLHETNAFFMDEPPRIPSEVGNLAESLYIPRRGWYLAGEGPMPTPSYYHLRPPADISRLTNADHAHMRGFLGTGVKVAMVDTGFIQDHDYYASRGYTITVHAVVGSATQDEIGHGTAIASNLLAVAPQWATLAAFRMAVQDGARIITNSWGQNPGPMLEVEIQAAVAAGVTVIFACGNGCLIGWPGCMPEVISVGGAYPRQDGTWEASSYASSGWCSCIHPRHVPDFCGIVGQAPHGILIVMPTMPGSDLDVFFSDSTFPGGDETAPDDGWLVASGTSSAAPMVAGAAALLLQAKSSLTPADIKQTLAGTCLDVVQGASANGEVAGIGPDSPTGAGMINIGAAVDRVAPYRICPTAPIPVCPTAPVELRECLPGPIPMCLRAPSECPVLPAFLPCRPGPGPWWECPRAPLIPECPPSPVLGCLAGPWRKVIDLRETIIDPERVGLPERRVPRRFVPVVIMVDEERLAMWEASAGPDVRPSREGVHRAALLAAKKAYYAAVEKLGTSGEFTDFPDVEGCQKGPFNPTAEE
jgi:hypothetical protein